MRGSEIFARNLEIPQVAQQYLEGFPGYMTPEAIAEHSGDVARAYFVERVAKRDWPSVVPALDGVLENVLDIGGGIGGVSLLLVKMAGVKSVTLVEKSEREAIEGHAYPHRAARGLFRANHIPDRVLEILDVYDQTLFAKLSGRSYDLILSLRALAFLFPYEMYRPTLLEVLKPGGRMILDIRKLGSNFVANSHANVQRRFTEAREHGEVFEQIRADFGSARVLLDGANSMRVLVTRTK